MVRAAEAVLAAEGVRAGAGVSGADASTADRAVFLATVVDVAGSAYRRPGARMLILPDGRHIGGISGGCLERDLCRAAPTLAADGPCVVSFDTRDEAAGVTPRYNLGCQGVIHVLVERVTGGDGCPLAPVRAAIEGDEPIMHAVVYHREDGGVRADGGGDAGKQTDSLHPVGHQWDADTLVRDVPELAPHVEQVRTSGQPVCIELQTGAASTRLLLERIDPPRPLWIFGAGQDAEPLAAIARTLGWSVTVIDRRSERLDAARFPGASLLHADPGDAAARLRWSPRTAAVLMTHDLGEDTALLPWLLGPGTGYVGLLGPKKRTARLLRDLHGQGRLPDPSALDCLHTPVGLDLGASTSADIALAIVGEITAVMNGRPGGRLADRTGPIHDPTAHVLVETVGATSDALAGAPGGTQGDAPGGATTSDAAGATAPTAPHSRAIGTPLPDACGCTGPSDATPHS